ncbi:unnamed protein product [Zymoseptoria tritici ST99CH_1A5]|uniref:Utp8 beta-propeller domain-containing protein n=5 Tax=Zymoseptoria tritici TaxID=1047171 RepID=A0A1X7RKG2_ZYMT9|nr:unnamed protein product [Zymoseptoria tritici ST99CH_3D7]SMR46411.1 unnamed protein product [Zymoseptoria tritici ST99CH_1E4]SMR47661.1 unnamed protein product [Zymoseptoria tritici ST99CH_3D1]SMY21565.1 unnamed protein product [Zymoseptoria tritici ST99CH_1A5]
MSGGIEEPYAIASLPTPFDAEKGRILAAPIHSISGSRKRKRHEVAVGIDGESLNIYSIQNQSTVSSYALSPQSYLAAPPCSIYCKRAKPTQPQRRTYLALRDGVTSSKARLVNITEELGKLRSEEREPRAPAKRERKLRHSNISGLEVVQFGEDIDSPSSKSGVLVFYTSGNIDCLTGDLEGSRWEHSTTEVGLEVEHSSVVTFDAARKGLLKNREDILSVLESTGTGTPLLLLQVVRMGTTRKVRIYALRNVSGDTVNPSRSPLDEVLSYDLPTRQQAHEDVATYDLHAASGTLYQLIRKRLTLYDLSGTSPRISFELGRKSGARVSGFARLSTASVVALSEDRIDVYDTKFGSILSSLTPTVQNGRNTPLDIITNFSDPSLFIAIRQPDLVVVQLGNVVSESAHAKSDGPLLAEVMGKGKASTEAYALSLVDKSSKKKKSWEVWTTKVDDLVVSGDVSGLEALIAQDLRLDNTSTQPNGGLTNGNTAHDRQTEDWVLPPAAYDPQHVDTKKASYILGKVFAWRPSSTNSNPNTSSLVVKIRSRNIICWLLLAGYIAPTHVQQALQASSADGSKPRIAPGDIMAAINEIDTGFALLCDLITVDAYWDVYELVQGLKVVMESLEDGIATPTQGLLTDADAAMTDVDDEAQLQAELNAAETQMDEAEDMLASGVAVRSEALSVLLARLSGFPHRDVAKAMSLMWNHDDILFFIAILRLELINGGWTKLYVDPEDDISIEHAKGPENVQDISPRNEAIRTIATLFSCAIDAIGLSGWLVGLSGDPERASDLMQSLRYEISAVLEGLFADAALGNCINEISKAASSLETPTLKRKRHQNLEDSAVETGQLAMPLGGRSGAPTNKSWNIAEQKSRRAEAEQKNRAVGKYSFERIRI